jgi:hypothetical protein
MGYLWDRCVLNDADVVDWGGCIPVPLNNLHMESIIIMSWNDDDISPPPPPPPLVVVVVVPLPPPLLLLLVSVPYWEWNKLGKDEVEKQEYLRELLELTEKSRNNSS